MPCFSFSLKQMFYAAAALALCGFAWAADIGDSLAVVASTNRSAAASQEKIDKLALESQQALEEYRRLRNNAEYQVAYTEELQQLNDEQSLQIENLQQAIAEARITQQRIVPLMRSMADALEKFVVLDLPFHHETRIASVLQLKQRLRQPGLSVSAKFRLLLEAYQLEQDYNATTEAWRGPLRVGEEELSVEFLRIGRVALYYQSLDGQRSGYWDSEQQDWLALDDQYAAAISEALRVARNLKAPQLLSLPMLKPGAAS